MKIFRIVLLVLVIVGGILTWGVGGVTLYQTEGVVDLSNEKEMARLTELVEHPSTVLVATQPAVRLARGDTALRLILQARLSSLNSYRLLHTTDITGTGTQVTDYFRSVPSIVGLILVLSSALAAFVTITADSTTVGE